MSTKQLQLKIVTPEKLVHEEMVDSVTVSTTEGELTILPHHIPIIALLASGDVVGVVDGEPVPVAIVGGFLEVKQEKEQTFVVILADFAEHVSDISEDEIEKAKQQAIELRLQAKNDSIVDFEHFQTELERSLTRVKIADKWRRKKYRR